MLKKILRNGLIALLMVCGGSFGNVNNGSGSAEAITFYWENDSRFSKPNHATDRHYTNGMKAVLTFEPSWLWLEDAMDVDKLNGEELKAGWFMGQSMYTPDHINRPSRRKNKDMKFAGWLYGGLIVEKKNAGELEHIEINAGVIGPSAQAEEVQECIHGMVGSDKPEGWDEQIDDEFAFDLTWNKSCIITHVPQLFDYECDLIPEYGFTAGSVHRHLSAGITYRVGLNLPGDFGPGRLEKPSLFGKQRTHGYGGYVFCRGGGKVIEHNRFLTGLDTKPLKADIQVGILLYRGAFEVCYSQTFQSHDYEEQTSEDNFGALTLTYKF